MQDIHPKKKPFDLPGYSFGYRLDDPTNPYPGPGAYSPSNSKSPVGVKFTLSTRFNRPSLKNRLPGPGAYNSLSLHTHNTSASSLKNGGYFTKGERSSIFPNVSSTMVGPGQYNVKRDFEEISTMRKSPSPPPEEGEKKVKKILSKVAPMPGPGQYDVIKAITSKHRNSPGFSIGNSNRDFMDVRQAAHQGMTGDIFRYSQMDYIGRESPKHSFTVGKRSELSPPRNVPGPTAYNIDIADYNKKGSVKGTFGSGARKLNSITREQEYAPGPGEYDIILDSVTRGLKMSKSSKTLEYNNGVPGPGQYDFYNEFDEKKREIERKAALAQSLSNSKALAISQLRNEAKKEDNIKVFDSLTQLSIATLSDSYLRDKSPGTKDQNVRSKWMEDIVKKSVSPGPAYLVEHDNIAKNLGSTGSKFSSLARPDFAVSEIKSKREIPGPGKYDMQSTPADKRSFSFAKAQKKKDPMLQEHLLETPGPEKYVVQVMQKSVVGGAIGKSERRTEFDKTSPKKKKEEVKDGESGDSREMGKHFLLANSSTLEKVV